VLHTSIRVVMDDVDTVTTIVRIEFEETSRLSRRPPQVVIPSGST
jgi:hypothetical protein